MSTHYPDLWVILKITVAEEQPLYKVFASWRGGYTTGDSWKLNSGITKVIAEENSWLFLGSSGSIYSCNKDTYGTTTYTQGVLNKLLKGSNAMKNEMQVQMLSKEEALEFIMAQSASNATPYNGNISEDRETVCVKY